MGWSAGVQRGAGAGHRKKLSMFCCAAFDIELTYNQLVTKCSSHESSYTQQKFRMGPVGRGRPSYLKPPFATALVPLTVCMHGHSDR